MTNFLSFPLFSRPESKSLGRFCRESQKSSLELRSSANAMLVHFHSDDIVNLQGFRASYRAHNNDRGTQQEPSKSTLRWALGFTPDVNSVLLTHRVLSVTFPKVCLELSKWNFRLPCRSIKGVSNRWAITIATYLGCSDRGTGIKWGPRHRCLTNTTGCFHNE